MLAYRPDLPLISLHIPKCAGSSFYRALKRWFGYRLLKHYMDEKRNKPPRKHSLTTGLFKKRYRNKLCIHGHFHNTGGYGVADYYPEVNQFITVLRDPFEVHVSNYFYVKKCGEKAMKDGEQHPIIAQKMSLESYLNKNRKSYYCEFLPAGISVENYRQVFDEKFIYIGVAEHLQTSVNMLAKKLGFPAIKVPTINISPRNDDVPAGARDEFILNNPLEMAMYEHALSNYNT